MGGSKSERLTAAVSMYGGVMSMPSSDGAFMVGGGVVGGALMAPSSAAATSSSSSLPPQRNRVGKFTHHPTSRHYMVFSDGFSRLDRLQCHMAMNARMPPTMALCSDCLELRIVTSPRHPAFGQYGLFAIERVPPNTIITPYAGFVQMHGTVPNSQVYTMGFGGEGSKLEIDAEFATNLGRFANDPRNTGSQANVTANNRCTRLGEQFTALVTKRALQPGDEVLMDYGKLHHLAPQPWLDRWNRPLTRRRARDPPLAAWTKASLPVGSSPLPVLNVQFQCCQCGGWSPLCDLGQRAPANCRCLDCSQPRDPCSALVATIVVPTEASRRLTDAAEAVASLTRSLKKRPRNDAAALSNEKHHCESVEGSLEEAVFSEGVKGMENPEGGGGDDGTLGFEKQSWLSVLVKHRARLQQHQQISSAPAQSAVGDGATPSALPPSVSVASIAAGWPLTVPRLSWQLVDIELRSGDLWSMGKYNPLPPVQPCVVAQATTTPSSAPHPSRVATSSNGRAAGMDGKCAAVGYVKPMGLFSTKSFTAGEEVVAVGGVIVSLSREGHRCWTARTAEGREQWPDRALASPPLVVYPFSLLGSEPRGWEVCDQEGATHETLIEPGSLDDAALLATSEVALVRVASNSSWRKRLHDRLASACRLAALQHPVVFPYASHRVLGNPFANVAPGASGNDVGTPTDSASGSAPPRGPPSAGQYAPTPAPHGGATPHGCVTTATGGSGIGCLPNVAPVLRRDRLGFHYVALVATRPILEWTELIV